jgi:hypothetical protein
VPYGYKKDPDDPKRWIIDEEAAAVVRRIYAMTLDGYGTEQVAAALEQDQILIPSEYWKSKGIKHPTRRTETEPCHWNSSTIVHVLGLQEYCGDVINFKTYSKSYKNKKRIENTPENMAIFKDVHEAIISRADWEKVQAKRGKARKRKTKDGEKNMFSGLIVCADCGHNLHYHFNQGNPEIKYFNCSNYKGNRGTCPTTHYIRVDFLEQVVLGEIRRMTKFASRYEDEFARLVMGHSQKVVEIDRQAKQRELNALNSRDREIDNLFNRMYEDNASGKIDDTRFAKMSRQYADEQAAITEAVKSLRAELEMKTDKAMTTGAFIAMVRKYTRAKKLTQRMLNELIEKIEVHHADKSSGEHRQKIVIHYACVGSIEIPDIAELPEPEIRIQTRKGVAINYSANETITEPTAV